jgi:hypothetical protein
MREDPTRGERRLWNRVTTIKLALQMLDRRTDLLPFQRALVRTASEALDGLVGELVERRRIETDAARPSRSMRREARWAPTAAGVLRSRPAAAAAALMGLVLLVLIVVGSALLAQILWVVLLVGVVAWLSRR